MVAAKETSEANLQRNASNLTEKQNTLPTQHRENGKVLDWPCQSAHP